MLFSERKELLELEEGLYDSYSSTKWTDFIWGVDFPSLLSFLSDFLISHEKARMVLFGSCSPPWGSWGCILVFCSQGNGRLKIPLILVYSS